MFHGPNPVMFGTAYQPGPDWREDFQARGRSRCSPILPGALQTRHLWLLHGGQLRVIARRYILLAPGMSDPFGLIPSMLHSDVLPKRLSRTVRGKSGRYVLAAGCFRSAVSSRVARGRRACRKQSVICPHRVEPASGYDFKSDVQLMYEPNAERFWIAAGSKVHARCVGRSKTCGNSR
jgi:hypothetical protein